MWAKSNVVPSSRRGRSAGQAWDFAEVPLSLQRYLSWKCVVMTDVASHRASDGPVRPAAGIRTCAWSEDGAQFSTPPTPGGFSYVVERPQTAEASKRKTQQTQEPRRNILRELPPKTEEWPAGWQAGTGRV
jgi:hypothetical protein